VPKVDITALRTEITTDPRGYGYAALYGAGNDQAVADLMNLVRDGTNPPANPTAVAPTLTNPSPGVAGVANGTITVRKPDVDVARLIEAIDLADWTALGASPTAAQLSTERRQIGYLNTLASLGTAGKVRTVNDDGTNAPVATNLLSIFPASPTRTRLNAAATRNGSRAEERFGPNVQVTKDDVSATR
jgi:hypothetical protein